MELILNELSIMPLSGDRQLAMQKMVIFAKSTASARRLGIRNIKSDIFEYQIYLAEGYSLKDWLTDPEVTLDLKSQMFGTIIPPFIRDEDEHILGQYLDVSYKYVDDDGVKTECIGLAAAYLYDAVSISFSSAPNWCRNLLLLSVEREDLTDKRNIPNVFDEKSFVSPDISTFIERYAIIDLLPSGIKEEDKQVTLAGDHHGKKEMKALSDKLKTSEYVVEIRSTNYGGNKFVRKVHPNGQIEIVCMDADARYALLVTTTGRSLRETVEIAQRLTEKFS